MCANIKLINQRSTMDTRKDEREFEHPHMGISICPSSLSILSPRLADSGEKSPTAPDYEPLDGPTTSRSPTAPNYEPLNGPTTPRNSVYAPATILKQKFSASDEITWFDSFEQFKEICNTVVR